MATATTDTTGNKGTPDLAQQIREQLASAVSQGQQSFVDDTQAWIKAVWVVPALVLLKAQIDSAQQLAGVVITDKHDSPMAFPDM